MTPLLSTAILRAQSDARLAALAADGHERAFEVIVERHRRPLLAHARRILPEGRAEDVVQQTFLSAWAALRDGQEVRDLRAWLHRIVHNGALNARKRAGYDYDELRDSLLGAGAPEEDLERRRVIRATLAGVAALPERQRQALLRTAVQGASQAEVARDLGITDGALRQLVHRARSSVRAAATVLTPFPLAVRLATAAAGGSGAAGGIGEVSVGAGAAGVSGALLKAGTAVVVAGAVATGASTELPRHHRAGAPPSPLAVEAADAAPAPSAPVPPTRPVTAVSLAPRRSSTRSHERGRHQRPVTLEQRGEDGSELSHSGKGSSGLVPEPSGDRHSGRHRGGGGDGDGDGRREGDDPAVQPLGSELPDSSSSGPGPGDQQPAGSPSGGEGGGGQTGDSHDGGSGGSDGGSGADGGSSSGPGPSGDG